MVVKRVSVIGDGGYRLREVRDGHGNVNKSSLRDPPREFVSDRRLALQSSSDAVALSAVNQQHCRAERKSTCPCGRKAFS